jgi:hypothetical protein
MEVPEVAVFYGVATICSSTQMSSGRTYGRILIFGFLGFCSISRFSRVSRFAIFWEIQKPPFFGNVKNAPPQGIKSMDAKMLLLGEGLDLGKLVILWWGMVKYTI